MKRINLFLALLLSGSTLSFGAAVPATTAKNVGYNYLHQHGNTSLKSAADLQLIYTSGKNTALFYVFGTNDCFVIVSAEDGVKPVLGYANDNTFKTSNMPATVSGFLDNYNEQIQYVITNNITPSAAITASWAALEQNKATAAKTTATSVSPLLTTHWDQGTYYNTLVPADASSGTSLNNHCPTGCVATAMAQVMRYWKWPATGTGSHTYSSAYGALGSNFGTTTYNWAIMPYMVTANNPAVAGLMSDLGISVNMDYAAQESGSYVTINASPITNCAEYALKTYFKYASSLHGVARSGSMTDATWISTIKTELDAARPVIYDGATATHEGHCFVFDGYDASDNFHVNWGWSGNSDGYFTVDALNPPALGTGGGTGGGFNDYQHIIVGIQPNGEPLVVTPDIYEVNDSASVAYTLPLTWVSNVATKSTTGSNFHLTTDKDFYKIVLPAGYNYSIKARINDALNSDDTGITYTADAMWAYSLNNGVSWSVSYTDTVPTANYINLTGLTGGTVIFRVLPKYQGTMGSYVLKLLSVKRSFPTAVTDVALADVKIFPNPASSQFTVDLEGTGYNAKNLVLTDMQGRTVYGADVTGQARIVVPVQGLPAGMYVLNISTDGGNIERKVSVGVQ